MTEKIKIRYYDLSMIFKFCINYIDMFVYQKYMNDFSIIEYIYQININENTLFQLSLY